MQAARQTEEPFFSGYQWCVEKAAYPRGRKKKGPERGVTALLLLRGKKKKKVKGPEPSITDITTVKT